MKAAARDEQACPAFLPVGQAHHLQARIQPEPAQRLRLPGRRPVANPGQRSDLAAGAGDQVGQGPPGQVRGRDPVTHVTARPADPGAAVQAD